MRVCLKLVWNTLISVNYADDVILRTRLNLKSQEIEVSLFLVGYMVFVCSFKGTE